MLLSGCGYATLIGTAAFRRMLGYLRLLFPNFFDFTFTPDCRLFPEAPLLISLARLSLSYPVIFVKKYISFLSSLTPSKF